MSWKYALGIFVVSNIVSVILTGRISKKIGEVTNRDLAVFYQYMVCSGLAILYALFFGQGETLRPAILAIGAFGIINAFGNYFQWEAQGISESKTPLFFPLFDVGDVILAMIFLGETKLWNSQLTIGALLCFSALWLLKIGAKGKKEENLTLKWLLFVFLMILVFATDGFAVKVFASEYPVSRSTLLVGFYVGSFIGTFPLLKLKRQKITKIPIKTGLQISTVSVTIMIAIVLLFWTYQLGGPISLVLPVRAIGITIVPALFGLFIVGERKGLTKKEWLGFLLGAIGGILVILR